MAFTERYVTAAATGGGDGLAEGTAWTLAEAAAGVAAGQRINVKADATYNRTAGVTFATAGPYRIQGYTATPGDGGRPVLDGAGAGASFTLLTVNGAGVEVFDLELSNNGPVGLADGLAASGARCLLCRVVVHDIGANAITVANVGIVVECEAYRWNKSGLASIAGFNLLNGTDLQAVRCVAHDPVGNGAVGFLSNQPLMLRGCIADSTTSHGFLFTGTYGTMSGCEAFACGGDGVRMSSASAGPFVIENCNFVRNGGYGINNSGGGTRSGVVHNCGFGSGTEANTSGQTNGLGNMDVVGSVTYAADVTPWADPANGDFRVSLAAAQGAGRGSYTQTQAGYTGTVGYPDIGAAQHQDAGGGGGAVVNPLNGLIVGRM